MFRAILPIALLFTFSRSYAACEDRLAWTPFFEPAFRRQTLEQQLGNRNFAEKRIGSANAEQNDSQVSIGIIRIGDRIDTYVSRSYRSHDSFPEAEARNAMEVLHWVDALVERRALGPFRPYKFIARVNNSVLSELVEGRSIEELKRDASLDQERMHQVVARFEDGLARIKAYCSEHRLECSDVRTEKSYGVSVKDNANGGRQIFIRSTNVVVDAQTGKFIVVSFD